MYGNGDYTIVEYEGHICPTDSSRSSQAGRGAKRGRCHRRPQIHSERIVTTPIAGEGVKVMNVVVVIMIYYPLREMGGDAENYGRMVMAPRASGQCLLRLTENPCSAPEIT